MTTAFSMLPMYDWPETRTAVDRLWEAIGDALRSQGIEAPSELRRPADLYTAWADDGLLLGQTCGLPLVQTLTSVEVVGAFDHRLPASPPGWYHSTIIVATDNDITAIADLRNARVAVNSADSQSGHAIWRHELSRRGLTGSFFSEVVVSGSHRDSVAAVASGRVDVAAVDAVSMQLAERFEPAASGVRILTRSEPTPGLPLITAGVNANCVPRLRRALHAAVESLPAAERHVLGIHAFVSLDRADYDLIAERWRDADMVPPLA